VGDSIQLNSTHVETDVQELQELAAGARKTRDREALLRARELYAGELLPGFTEEWILLERLRLEDLYLSLLRMSARGEEPEEAIAQLQVALAQDPLDERLHIEVMRRYLALGARDRALDQYERLKSALEQSFGRAPSPEATQLAARARMSANEGVPVPSDIPDQPSRESPRVSLPVQSNRFFGRTRETQELLEKLEDPDTRLLTVLGPAGVGKTRLTSEVATRVAGELGWDAWFVPMAERFNAGELGEAILTAIEPNRTRHENEAERLGQLTRDRRSLVVLDNLEQIAEDAGAILKPLLLAAPNVVILASSRQPLNVAEERLYPIEPLPLGGGFDSPSMQLFIDRCRAVRPDLRISPRNAEAIASLCARVDGMPLAIEIVAGLGSTLSPTQLVNHLPDHITGLESRRKDVPDRHRSLGAAIDWSYGYLDPQLQAVFRGLSVFRGGFTVDAIQEICSPRNPFQAIQSLVERSLALCLPEQEGLPPRFSLLVAFREYGAERLTADEMHELRERHAEFYLRLAPPNRPFWSIEEQTAAHAAIEAEYDNLTSAIEFSLDEGNLDRCIGLLQVLSVRWLSRGPRATERRLIAAISNNGGLDQLRPELRVQVKRMRGTTFIRSGDYQAAYDACREAVRIAEDTQDLPLLATCYSGLSVCAGYLSRFEECLELNRQVLQLVGDQDLILAERSHLGMGSVLLSYGRLDEAAEALSEARRISQALRGGEPDALIVVNQARVALDRGKPDHALALVGEAMRISKRLHDEFTLAVALTVLCRCQMLAGDFTAAIATNLAALERCVQGDFPFFVELCLRTHARLWAEQRPRPEAVTLAVSVADAQALPESDEQVALQKLQAQLMPEEFELARARGLGMTLNAAVQMVLGE
jgi:predicted ATPase